MTENNTSNEKSLQSLKNGMDEPEDAEFRAFREWMKTEMSRYFNSEGLGMPATSDYRFMWNLYNRIRADIYNAFPSCIPTITLDELGDVHALLFTRYVKIIRDEVDDDFRKRYNLAPEKLKVILYLTSACVLDPLIVDGTNVLRAKGDEITDNETAMTYS